MYNKIMNEIYVYRLNKVEFRKSNRIQNKKGR